MKGKLSKVLGCLAVYLILLPFTYAVIFLDEITNKIKKNYYDIAGIPYLTIRGKFGPFYIRRNK